jgi:chromosome partitioning protein
MLSMNSLAAADFLLITLQCEYMALEGLGQILRNVERLKTAGINPRSSSAGS